jgi:hypothetical protein
LSIWSYALNSPPNVSAHHLRQRRRQRRLAVVNVTDRAHVHVRLLTLEFFLGHDARLQSSNESIAMNNQRPSAPWSGSHATE